MISAKQFGPQQLLVDFGSPIISQAVVASAFTVQGHTIANITFKLHELEINLNEIITENELWLEYTAPAIGGIIRTVGPTSEALIKSFEVLVQQANLAVTSPEPYNLVSTTARPTLGDFIDAFGLEEAIRITNPNDSAALQPNELVFLRAIEDAEALWNSETLNAPAAGLLVLNPGKRRTLLTFARYFLDAFCPRPHVLKAYEEAIRNIKVATGAVVPVTDPNAFIGDEDYFFFGVKTGGCGCDPCGNESQGSLLGGSWLRA